MSADDASPVIKVGLKRLQVTELVGADEALRACRLLLGLPADVRDSLLAGAQLIRFVDGSQLFASGDRSDSLFLVARGEVRLLGKHEAQVVEAGVAHKGEVVGEAESLGGKARAWTGIAVGEVDAIEFPRAAVTALMQRHPAVRDYLRELDAERKKALQDLGAFLGRW